MNDIGGSKEAMTQAESIDHFIAAFDGDPLAALRSLERRIISEAAVKEEVSYSKPISPVLLSVRGVTKSYAVGGRQITVLNEVSLDIHEGEIVAIIGSSGSGKSTLLQLMGGLDKPSAGDVFVGETNLAKLSDKKLAAFRGQTVGFVFQFFYLQPFLRLQRNLEVPGMFMRMARQVRKKRVQELAEKVGLADRLAHFPRELSGGQMQRAAIARALLNSPKILLADEPTGNLDSVNSDAIIGLFETIRRELGTTIVLVTHDNAIASRADRIIRISDGRVL